MRVRFLLPALSALLFTPVTLLAETHGDAHWIDRMSRAIHVLNYDGTFIYFHEGQLESMRIIHGVDDDGERERLVALNGPAREVIRDSQQVTCILREGSVVDKSGPSRLSAFKVPAHLGSLQGQYRFVVEGEDRVAGHAVRKLVIQPQDRYRYGHRLWLHKDNDLLLRSELINERGEVVEQLMFTSIQFFETPPKALLKPQIAERDVVISQPAAATAAQARVEEGRWRVAQLPAGFNIESHHEQVMARSENKAEHMVFSDGLASISVFIERSATSPELSYTGASRMGAINTYSRQHEGHRITVVGEVPALTVRQIADSITLSEHRRE